LYSWTSRSGLTEVEVGVIDWFLQVVDLVGRVEVGRLGEGGVVGVEDLVGIVVRHLGLEKRRALIDL